MGRKATPPDGADVLYSRLVRCDLIDGLVLIEVKSGEHMERGLVPLRVAMELHDRLSELLSRVGQVRCMKCERRERAHAH